MGNPTRCIHSQLLSQLQGIFGSFSLHALYTCFLSFSWFSAEFFFIACILCYLFIYSFRFFLYSPSSFRALIPSVLAVIFLLLALFKFYVLSLVLLCFFVAFLLCALFLICNFFICCGKGGGRIGSSRGRTGPVGTP